MRAISEKENIWFETKEEDKEAKVRPKDYRTKEARRGVVESLKILLATKVIPSDNDDIVTRAIEVTSLMAMAAIPIFQSS